MTVFRQIQKTDNKNHDYIKYIHKSTHPDFRNTRIWLKIYNFL